jgi:Domain of unknown function (DUF4258)
MEGESAVKHRPVVRLAEPRRAAEGGVASLFTEHARTRMQQRGIPATAVDLLLEYGKTAPAGRGCEIVFLDKTYAILGANGAIVTVGHRTRRIPRS